MRNLITSTFLSFIALGLSAQNSVTLSGNALTPGDSYTSREIQFVDPGSAGINQIWDYSKIQYTEKTIAGDVQTKGNAALNGLGDYNLTLNEDGYNFFLNATDNKLEELGYTNKEKNMTLVYSNPVMKMKYPFAFGDNFTDPFTGIAYYNKDYRIDFSGDVNVSADATGTLILPETVLNNTLRVRTFKQGVQVNPCGSVKISITKYAWYVTGNRYPVMTLTTVENKFSNGKVEFIQTGTTNLPKTIASTTNTQTGNSGSVSFNQTKNQDVTVSLFPNPFSDKITYNYFLRSKLPVSITLFDMAGRYNQQIINNEEQGEGLHSGSLDNLTSNLPAGVYYIRFIFDQQVVVSKVVKLEHN